MFLGVDRSGADAFADLVKSKETYLVSPSGKEISVTHPRPEDITLPDIALGLAAGKRFGGRTVFPYSIGQHSCSAALLLAVKEGSLKNPIVAAGLLHDASEATLGDVIKPLKAHLPDYVKIEETWMRAVATRFDIDFALFSDPRMAWADFTCYAVEVSALIRDCKPYGFTRRDLNKLVAEAVKLAPEAFLDTPRPWDDTRAATEFLTLAKDLGLS